MGPVGRKMDNPVDLLWTTTGSLGMEVPVRHCLYDEPPLAAVKRPPRRAPPVDTL
jgi:hypothetical protein